MAPQAAREAGAAGGAIAAGSEVDAGDDPDHRQRAEAESNPESLTAEELKAEFEDLEWAHKPGIDMARAWGKLWEKLIVSDLPSLAQSLVGPGKNVQGRALSSVIFAWCEKDPESAWSFARSISIPQQRDYAVSCVMQSVGRRDHMLALSMADEVKGSTAFNRSQWMALMTLAHENPPQAFDAIVQRGRLKNEAAVRGVFNEWALNDPLKAQAAAASLSGRAAQTARQSLVETLGQSNPQAAWDYAKSLASLHESGHFENSLQNRAIEIWAESDPAKAIEAAGTIEDAGARNNAVASAVNAWANTDFDAALACALAVPDKGTRGRILLNLADNDRADSQTMFNALVENAPAGSVFRDAMSKLMGNWARNEPREAAAAVAKLPVGGALAPAVEAIAEEWAGSRADRQQVMDWMLSLPEGSVRNGALRTVFERWGAQDPQMAKQFFAAQGRANEDALHGLVYGWSQSNPAEAARYAVSLSPDSIPTGPLRIAVGRWAASSPDDAAMFVQAAPEKLRPELTKSLVEVWSSRNPEGVASWIKKQPAGPSKDLAISELCSAIDQEDAETALAWARTISNEEIRMDRSEKILRTWLDEDPERAKAWMATARLPPDLKQRLENRD